MLPILLAIGPIYIYSFSVFLILAWVSWSFLFWKALWREGIEENIIFDLMFYSSLVAFICARAGYIAFHFQIFAETPLKVVALWVQPGLMLFAGLAGGGAILFFLAKKVKVPMGLLFDSLALSLSLSLLIGKIGSFLDGTEVGKSTKMIVGLRYLGHEGLRHPVQLYEIGGLLSLFVGLSFLQKRYMKQKRAPGQLGLRFFLLFPLVFFLLEFLKDSPVYWSLTVNQWVLVAVWAESVGVMYVNGGGREWLMPKLARIGTWLYTNIKRPKA